jgi:hypothetical protein
MFAVWQRVYGACHFLLPSQYGIATKPVFVTCAWPFHNLFSRFGKGVWGWQFPIIGNTTRFDALRAFKSLFGMFGKGVWRWSFPITIPIMNIGETHFGDLRAF